MTATSTTTGVGWPPILQRYASELGKGMQEYAPRPVRRRFHGTEVTAWEGFVHVDDVHGYAENIRLKFFLNKWRAKVRDPQRVPTSDEIYEIMTEADREEARAAAKPFHVERMADNIVRNGIQEPIIVYADGGGRAELWDGNRRFYGTMHIMRDPAFAGQREQAKWLPVHVITPAGAPSADERIKHAILTECNFVEKDHIPWPAYVKAEEIHRRYTKETAADPTDSVLRHHVKEALARDYGLKGWRVADRWIKMYELAAQFKEYHEEEHQRPEADVDLVIQERFEYFDELSKHGVWGALKDDPDARDEVFCWLWDGKFKSFADVRVVPKILNDPTARQLANEGGADGVKKAIETVIVNDPVRAKSKEAANAKIKQFAEWLNTFRREDYKQLNVESLESLRMVAQDTVRIIEGLLTAPAATATPAAPAPPAADPEAG